MESRPSVSRLVRAAREAAEIRAKEEASATDDTSEAHGASKAARDPKEEEKELERTKVKAELLKANSFVNRLPPRLQQELACAAKVRLVHEESPVILEQGDDVHKLAILCEGEAIVTHKADADDRHGVERPVRIDQAPASYGAYALLSGDEEQPETVRAIGPDCLCLELNGDDFDEILSNHNNAGFVLELRREARQAGLLDRVPLLSGLNEMQKVQILHAMRAIVFQDGEILAARAAREEVFLLVVNGTVRVTDLDATEEIEGDSSSSMPAPVSQVSYFGEFALLDDQRNAQTLIAEGEVVCLYMHRLAFLEQVPHLRRFLVEWVQASERQSERRAKSQERPEDSSDAHGPRTHCFDLDKPPCKSFAASIDKSASETFEILVPARSEDAKPRRMAFESVYEALALRVFHKKIVNSEFAKTFQIVSRRSQASPALRSLRGEIPAVSSNLFDVLASAQREEKLRKKKKKKKKNKNQKKNKKGNAIGSSAAIARIETPLAATGQDSALLLLTSRLAHHVRTILQSDPEQRSQEDLRVLHGLFAQNKVVSRLALRLDAPIEHRLFSHARFATFEAGQSLWQEGDAMTGVYMVLRGQVHTSMRERIGTSGTVVPKPLGTICAGGSLGELSLLDPEHKVYSKALYTAQALCDTEVLVLDAQSFHAHCVPQDLLRQRIADVSSIEQLSCTRGEANFAAIMPLAFQIDYAHFPKDFVFSQAGIFFEPGWCHFIMSGEIGVYEYNLDRQCWEELSRLGPGEFMSIADASPTLALAAVSFVSTKKLSRATLQALDETAAAEMNQVATFRAQFRKADDVHGVRARLAAAKICLPTFVQRQGGPLQRPSIAALAASTRAKHADAQASKVKMSRLAPLFKDGKVPDQDGSSDAGSQDLTQYPADPDLQQEQRQQQVVEAKPVWSWAALPAAEPQQDGEDSDIPHSGLTRENALGALRLVERHYSMAIEERHHAVCHTDAGIKRRSVGPVEHTSSLAVRRALLDKKLFLERALAARDPRKRVPILRQQRFALVSLHWGDK